MFGKKKQPETLLVAYMKHVSQPGNRKYIQQQMEELRERAGYDHVVVVEVEKDENVRLEALSVEGMTRLDMETFVKAINNPQEPNEKLKKAGEKYTEWDEERMNIIGQNGNDGIHYDTGNENGTDNNKAS